MGDDSTNGESVRKVSQSDRTNSSSVCPTPVQHRIHSHNNFGKCERLLEENVETVRQQVHECFQRCRVRLEDREAMLLMQINDEYRKLKRSMMASKRKAMVNNSCLNIDALLKGGGVGVSDISESSEATSLIRQSHNRNAHNNKGDKSDMPLKEDINPSSNNINLSNTSSNGSSLGGSLGVHHNGINGSGREMETLQTVLKQTETKQLHFTRANDSILAHYDHIISQMGMVYIGNSDPSRTLATCYPALVLAESVARIKGITKERKECTTGGSNVHAILCGPNGESTTCEVKDYQNGTYKVTYIPPNVGLHELHVMIAGQPIKNSPFEVFVKPVRLHINKAFLGGVCTVEVEMPKDYNMPIAEDRKTKGTRKPCLQSIQIIILDPNESEIEGSMLGAIKHKGAICTYTAKYTPLMQGDHEIIIKWVGDVDPIAQQVIPVHEKEQIGSKGCRQGEFINPTDVLVSPSGDIFIADTVENRRIQVFTPEGKFKMQFYVPLQEPGLIGANDNLLAVLFLNSKRIMIFNHKGSIISQFVPEDILQPYGIVVDSKSQIYITDRGQHSILIYDTTGKLTKKVGKYGSGPCQFDYPNYICLDVNDHIYISEAKNTRIQELDAQAAYNRELRSCDKLQQPGAIVTTDSGYLLVHNESNGKVHIINLDDLTFVGCIEVNLIAVYTRRIAVSKNGFLLALDMSNHCIWRYRIPYKS